MAFLQKQLFTTPTWLLDKSILDRISSPVNDRLSQLQDQVLGSLLSTGRLQRLSNSANRDAANAYRLDEFMDDLRKGVWSELAARKPIDNYRRNLQGTSRMMTISPSISHLLCQRIHSLSKLLELF